jgi:DNA invertase Pin-like site-specific DNA recombinase
MIIRTAIYARPSAAHALSADDQIAELHQLAESSGWTVTTVHRDAAPSGGRSGARRPALAAMLEGVRAGQYDLIVVQSIHLIGRDLSELVAILDAVRAVGARLVAVDEGVDTSGGALGLLEVAGLLVSFQRFQRREAIRAGQERARLQGATLGRPALDERKVQWVKDALMAGAGIRPAGRLAGISSTAALRVRDEMRAAGQLPA